MRFRRTRKGTEATLDDVEAGVLAALVGELLELLGDSDAVPDDPIEAMVGLSSEDVDTPDDAVLARLLPDAYGGTTPDHAQAAREFRRYTEQDLRAAKRAAASALLARLPQGGGTVLLDRDDADSWLGCLNDLRLALGTRLGVTEDTDLDAGAGPRGEGLRLYGWLGWVQESLLRCLSPRPS